MINLSKNIYNFLVNTLLWILFKNKFMVWVGTKIVDQVLKPLYDYLVRKSLMEIEKSKAKKAQETLDHAQTKEEREKAIDEIP